MLEFLFLPENLPFAVSCAVLLILAALEGVGALVGFGLSNLLDNLLPEADIASADIPDHGAVSEFLSWLRLRDVPVIVILIAFLMSYTITGLVLQQVVVMLFSAPLPAIVAALAALFLSVPGVRLFAQLMSKIMPKDETSAVSSSSFVGRTATITLGLAKSGQAAQAKLKDKFGQDHYVMVEPDGADGAFSQGEMVLLVRESGSIFYAIAVTNEHLTDA